jgi:uncharacterized protein RhaS with RHS repeats
MPKTQMPSEANSGNCTGARVLKSSARADGRIPPTGAVQYFFSDQVGSHTVITDSSGVRLRESDYYPFGGERVVLNNLSDEAHKFSGKERDAESGLDYFGARYYSIRFAA